MRSSIPKKSASKLSKQDRKLIRLARNSTLHVPDALKVGICGSNPQGPGSTWSGKTFSSYIKVFPINLLSRKENTFRIRKISQKLEKIIFLKNWEVQFRKKSASKLSKQDRKLSRLARNSTLHVPDALKVEICGSNPQGPGSTWSGNPFSSYIKAFPLNLLSRKEDNFRIRKISHKFEKLIFKKNWDHFNSGKTCILQLSKNDREVLDWLATFSTPISRPHL